VALVGCGTYDPASRTSFLRRSEQQLCEADRQELAELRAAMEREPDPARRDAQLRRMGGLFGRAQSCDLLEEEPDLPAVQVDAAGHQQTWRDALRLQEEGVEPAAFAAIRAPVLMLHGEQDPHPGPQIRDSLRPFLPQLRYRSFPRCGHSPWRERHAREPFLAALREWLQARSG